MVTNHFYTLVIIRNDWLVVWGRKASEMLNVEQNHVTLTWAILRRESTNCSAIV